MAEEPRSKIPRSASHEAKETARLQYILDTQMKEEPALGLEYIVEEQLTPEKFRYICRLCCAEGDMNWIFSHIVGRKHMLRYIEKHHHPSIFANRPLTHSSSFQEIRDQALFIQNMYGRKEIKRVQSKVNPAKQDSPLPGSQQVSRKCSVCFMFFCSAWTLCHHLMGGKHRKRLWMVAPEDVVKLARMQYILDNYIKEDPVVGLEYVMERRESESYRYTCNLCGVEADLFQSLIHVIGDDHMERYIRKHHSLMLPKVLPSTSKNVYARQLRESAFTILRTYGSKTVQIEVRSVSDPSLLEVARPVPIEEAVPVPIEEAVVPAPIEEAVPAPTEEARPALTEENGPSPTEEDAPSPTEDAPSPTEEVRPSPPKDVNEESGPFLHDEELDHCYQCRLCDMVFPSPVDLWNHVVGSKHKELLSKTSPKELKELGRLQYFLNNHMKKDPLLGLEYIVEEQLDSTYKYTCQLCNVEGDLPQMITHISCVDHVERYIDKDHSDLSLRVYTYPERADYIKALTIIARMILDKCGRQDIVLKCS